MLVCGFGEPPQKIRVRGGNPPAPPERVVVGNTNFPRSRDSDLRPKVPNQRVVVRIARSRSRDHRLESRVGQGRPPRTRIFWGATQRRQPHSRGGPEWPRGMRRSVVRGGRPCPTRHTDRESSAVEQQTSFRGRRSASRRPAPTRWTRRARAGATLRAAAGARASGPSPRAWRARPTGHASPRSGTPP